MACVGLVSVLVVFSNKSKSELNSKLNSVDQNAIQLASDLNGNIGDHTKGNLDSGFLLVEYGDYQCPGCAGVNPIVEQVIEDYKDKISYTFRNYILDYHANARAASSAVEAAGLQGKYWEMHSIMYDRQSEWESLDAEDRTDYMLDLAQELELDLDKFKTDMASDAVSTKISFDKSLGLKAGLTATPSFYINGEAIKLDDISDVESFKAYIDNYIANHQS